jgi:hypothetical protein
MVSSGQWGDAWVHPPGSNSDDMATGDAWVPREGNPYEVYTVPNIGGTRRTESDSLNWLGWEHHIFNK